MGYKKILRLAYQHFPINFTVVSGGKACEIRNFLGEKIVRKIDMLGDTVVGKSADTKDEVFVEGKPFAVLKFSERFSVLSLKTSRAASNKELVTSITSIRLESGTEGAPDSLLN